MIDHNEILKERGFTLYTPGGYTRRIGSMTVNCQSMASGFYIFVMDGTGHQPYQAVKIQIDELAFHIDKALQIAGLVGVK